MIWIAIAVVLAVIALALVFVAVTLWRQLQASQIATVAAKVSSDDELAEARSQAKEIVLEGQGRSRAPANKC